jgi:hypothetical protein
MKTTPQNLLQFPKAPQEAGKSPIVFQLGGDRFALHYTVEDLPPVDLVSLWKPQPRKPKAKIVNLKSGASTRRARVRKTHCAADV